MKFPILFNSHESHMKSVQRLQTYLLGIVHQRWIFPALFVFSLLESIIIPIPLELILVPLMLAGQRVWALAATALLGFLCGALLGYAAGAMLFEQFSDWLLATPQAWQHYLGGVEAMSDNGFWYLASVGITPLPSQIAMLVGGSTGFPLPLFMLAMLISRAARYFILAYVMRTWGESGYQWLLAHQSTARKLAWLALGLAIILVLS